MCYAYETIGAAALKVWLYYLSGALEDKEVQQITRIVEMLERQGLEVMHPPNPKED